MRMNALDWISYILLVIGGINWGLIGFFDYNLVASLFGEGTTITRIIYSLVGLSALYMLTFMARIPSSRGTVDRTYGSRMGV